MSSSATLERVHTPRLVCERLRMEHLPEISPLLRNPRVAEWLWPHGEPSEQHVIDGTRQKERHWESYGFGLWLLRDSESQEAVGWGGLQRTHVADLDQVEVAWAITPRRWRQGLATELAQTAIATAFGPLGLREIIAFTLPHNLASRRVMEKTGLAYEREIVHVLLIHVLYRRGNDGPVG